MRYDELSDEKLDEILARVWPVIKGSDLAEPAAAPAVGPGPGMSDGTRV
jgi:hypothetical protein